MEFFIDNLLVRIHFIIVMIRWNGLAPWESEFPFPGSLTSTFLVPLSVKQSQIDTLGSRQKFIILERERARVNQILLEEGKGFRDLMGQRLVYQFANTTTARQRGKSNDT